MDIIDKIFDELKAKNKSQVDFAEFLRVPKSLITHSSTVYINKKLPEGIKKDAEKTARANARRNRENLRRHQEEYARL